MFRKRTTLGDVHVGDSERLLRGAAAALFLFPLSGCAHGNELNLFGAYFPVWLLAIIVGAAAAFGCRFLFVRLRVEPYLGSLTLIYVCITVSVSCLVWLLFV